MNKKASHNIGFNPDLVIRYSGKAEVLELHEQGKLMDILPTIDTNTNRMDSAILESWEKYFKSIGTPYAVMRNATKAGDSVSLWKERRV